MERNTMKAGGAVAQRAQAPPIMSLDHVSRHFGALKALDDLTFDIGEGEILGIAGPNGAGKTTLLNVCTGVMPASAGKLTFEGEALAGLPAHRCCHLGLARTFQIPQIFSSMSVEENVATGAMFGARASSADALAARVSDVLTITGLIGQRHEPASRADLLTRKRIMLAAALATNPKLIFLDEPLAGLNAEEVDIFVGLFRRLHAALKLTLVVVEHKVRALASLSDRILILNAGSLLCLDRPEAVLRDARVIEIYLGARNFA
jgi:branched-chain amino acid transport system ATP-binding protein